MRTLLFLPALILAFALFFCGTVTAAAPLYVNGSSGDDQWDGTSPTHINTTIGPMKTIQTGINAVDSEGTVNVADGTYAEHLVISKSLTIQGQSSQNTIVDGTNSGRTFQISSGVVVYLNNLTVTHGSSNIGAGIYNTATLNVNNCIITQNVASAAGGGMYSSGVTTINNSFISENNAPSGGGIFHNGGTLYYKIMNINNTEISSNTGETAGGGIYTSEGTLNMVNSNIIENIGSSGGGLCIFRLTVNITGSSISRNTGTLGGAIYFDNGYLNLTSSRLDKNHAINGGAIYNYMAGVFTDNLIITCCNVTMNDAQENGGALYNRYALKMNFNRIVDNTASMGTNIYNEAGSCNVENNWWGVNTTPPGISVIGGAVDANPWLILDVTGSPTTILTGATSTITANLNRNSDGTLVGNSTNHVPDGTIFNFQTNIGTISAQTGSVNGIVSDTYSAPSTPGTAIINTLVDSQTIPITIDIKSLNIYVEPLNGNNTNPGTFLHPVQTIQRALEMIFTGGTITLNNGIYNENSLRIGQPLTIRGQNPLFTVINGGGVGLIIEIATNNVLLENLKITGGSGVNGGGIHNTGSNVTINNCFITNNLAQYGGGVWNMGTLKISNSIISQNNAIDGLNNGNGGGISNSQGMINIENSSITQNFANYAGGGISSNMGTINIKNSDIMLNQADYGGGIYNYGNSSSTWNFNRIVDNSAIEGSNIYIQSTIVDATNNWWGNNSGPTGVYVLSGSINTTPWLIMEVNVKPNTPATGTNSQLTVNLNKNSDGIVVGDNTNHLLNGIQIFFSATSGTIPSFLILTNGEGSTFYTAPATAGDVILTSSLNHQDINTLIQVRLADIYANFQTGIDSNPGTIILPVKNVARALEKVAYNGTIHLQPVLGGYESGGSSVSIIITQPVTIIAESNEPLKKIISAGGIYGRVIEILSGVNNVKLINLWIQMGGFQSMYIDGAGVKNSGGTDEEPNQIINCTISDCEGSYGAGLANYGVINVINSDISYNSGRREGGGIFNNGGSLITIAKMTLTNTNVSNNSLNNDRYPVYGVGIANRGTMEINNGTVSDNQISLYWAKYGGGIYNSGNLIINNTIIANNYATEGGGIYNDGGIFTSTIIITNSTIQNNTASLSWKNGQGIYTSGGGGIYNKGNMTLHFNRITGNMAIDDPNPPIIQHGSNLFNDADIISAEDNWWGVNSDPGSEIFGSVNYSPWLYMTLTAVPTLILNGGTSQINTSFNNAYDGVTITPINPATGHLPDGSSVTFTTDLGNMGSKTVAKNTDNGISTATLTANEGLGIANISAQFDNQIINTEVLITQNRDVYPGQSIQNAINLSIPWETILVHGNGESAATYNENILINKAILMRTAGDGLVTIQPSTTGDAVIVVNSGGNGFTIQGFKIFGASGSLEFSWTMQITLFSSTTL